MYAACKRSLVVKASDGVELDIEQLISASDRMRFAEAEDGVGVTLHRYTVT
jgi:hypothetical protein